MLEKMGDRPAWMKIKKYKAEGRRSELILTLNKKNYWFPLSPKVYDNFRSKIQESRLDGLRYLQDYIRRYRDYAGRWPSRRYVERNKLKGKSLVESIAGHVMRLHEAGVSIEDIKNATYLPGPLVTKFLQVAGKLHPEQD